MFLQIPDQFTDPVHGPEFDLGHPRLELSIIPLLGDVTANESTGREWDAGADARAVRDLVANVRELTNDHRIQFAQGLRNALGVFDELRAWSAIRFAWATPLALSVALAALAGEEFRPVMYWTSGGGGLNRDDFSGLTGPRKPSWMT